MNKKPPVRKGSGSIGADIVRQMIANYERQQKEDSFTIKIQNKK